MGVPAVWRFLIGPPLRARQAAKQQITPIEGLPALSLDALTSVAYGPEAIIVVLAAAGIAALPLVLPISIAIVVLLAILVFSYRQVIEAYPGGGGTYAVCRANFPPGVGLLAAAALVVDYTLTVAVSIAAGVGSLTSAFPGLSSATVPICLVILAVVTGLNLRGLGDTARAFLLPTMVFIVGLLAVIAIGLIHPLAPHVPRQGRPLVPTEGLESVGVLLVLKAFSAGCSALTGVEAIANGVPLFKQPRVVRAKRTELLLGGILGVMLLGLAVLANRWHISPRFGETVLSQVIATAVGRNWAYYVMSLTITVVLMLAANTSFGGLPVLTSRLAGDNYLPHQFSLRDERQVFAIGIWTLAGLAAVLLVAVRGQTLRLIPLYAIGVFTAFTLAQSGLVKHWRQTRPARWHYRAVINGVGAATTGVATVTFLVTKFTVGAWVVVLAVPALIMLFVRTHAYYARCGRALGLDEIPARPHAKPTMVVVPVTGVDRLTQHAIAEALSISPRVVAVHVVVEDTGQNAERDSELDRRWARWNPGVPLKILHTEYASVVRPISAFIDEIHDQHDEQIVVLIPVALPRRLRYRFLHNHLEIALAAALKTRPDVIVASVPVPLRVS
ncbi:APC family permease [Dactylosporangium sp. NPDC000244]|uniref:APC family permease n=1 Tax=Dactylosporangium sp. NPDC000244 TaxID=3154365 RepID=UPI00332EF3D2